MRTAVGAAPWPLKPLAWILPTRDEHATLARMFISQHVKDLRLIATMAVLALYATIVVLVVDVVVKLGGEANLVHLVQSAKDASWWNLVHHILFEVLQKFLIIFPPVLTVVWAILSWVYQVGSTRLGVVDLFACEISTLCKVATLIDTVQRQVEAFQKGPPDAPAQPAAAHEPARSFTSQDSYFPVFENNSRDLETLEAKVVINITAFYTYMKAVRDLLRTVAAAPPAADPEASGRRIQADDPWREAASNVIYMLFLALESARFAINQLVEFEPEGAERTITILISELPAYGFLRRRYQDAADFRHQRIMLREPDYQALEPRVQGAVEAGLREAHQAKNKAIGADAKARAAQLEQRWTAAELLLAELHTRFEEAMRPGRTSPRAPRPRASGRAPWPRPADGAAVSSRPSGRPRPRPSAPS